MLASANAPGKAVLWGEYAVLADAPAAVAAVSHRASVTIEPSMDGRFRFTSSGLQTSPACLPGLVPLDQAPEPSRIAHAVAQLFAHDQVAPCTVHSDSSAFWAEGKKVGLGSSAAITVATYGAMCRWCNQTPSLEEAISAHRAFQGGGSGMDVAASFHGGALRFQSGEAAALVLPDSMRFYFFFVGESASTAAHLASFARWRDRGETILLNELAAASLALFDHTSDRQFWNEYAQALHALDEQAKLGIYSDEHRAVEQLARTLGLFYKPCGAGGGDLGMVVSFGKEDEAQISKLCQTIAGGTVQKLDVAIEPLGLSVA